MLSFDEVKERLEQLSRQPTAVVGSGSYVARWRGLTYGEVYEHEAEYIAATNLLEQFIRDITPEDDLRENDQRVVLQEEVMRIFSIEVSSVFLEVARANWDDAHPNVQSAMAMRSALVDYRLDINGIRLDNWKEYVQQNKRIIIQE